MKTHKRGDNKENIAPQPYCEFILCDRWPHPRIISTRDNSKVTCKKCLKIMFKQEQKDGN